MCAVVDFTLRNERKFKMIQFYEKNYKNTHDESVEYDDKVIVELIKKHFPDFRRVINELQRYSQLQVRLMLYSITTCDVPIEKIVSHIKDKELWGEVRKYKSLQMM